MSLRPVGSAHLQLAASMATALSLAAAAAEPAPVCPSTIDVNSSFVPHAPFQTVVGAKVATP
eukprot:COSAG06_NODE_27390_length_594_cov_0.935354_1_plen_61_part_10